MTIISSKKYLKGISILRCQKYKIYINRKIHRHISCIYIQTFKVKQYKIKKT